VASAHDSGVTFDAVVHGYVYRESGGSEGKTGEQIGEQNHFQK